MVTLQAAIGLGLFAPILFIFLMCVLLVLIGIWNSTLGKKTKTIPLLIAYIIAAVVAALIMIYIFSHLDGRYT
jgi:uncharacterized membrane protein YiaA